MRPTLRQLQYLVAVHDLGRFGEAAKKLNVSQPSLSTQIAEVEALLGVTLIERGRHGAVATPLGRELIERARTILRDVEDLKARARHGDDTLRGRISIGVLPTIGPYLLPGAVRSLHTAFPELRMAVREERTVDLDADLRNGAIDCIISRPEDHPDAVHRVLFEEEFYICCAPEDALMRTEVPAVLSDLRGRELLSLGPGHGLTAVLQQLAGLAGAGLSAEYFGTSLDAMRQTALMGTGVAILPSLYALQEAKRDPDLSLRRIDHPVAHRTLALIWRDSSPLTAQFEQVARILAEEAKTLLAERDGPVTVAATA
jgi:LysR family hydrogen peroxide-inducible transcriptional activator